MNIDEITIGEAKELAKLFGSNTVSQTQTKGLQTMIGKKVIVRTHCAGCWYGELTEKEGMEVILKNARRMWRWFAGGNGISLSECSIYGVVHEKSKIVSPVDLIALEATEIIPCTDVAIKSLEGARNVTA